MREWAYPGVKKNVSEYRWAYARVCCDQTIKKHYNFKSDKYLSFKRLTVLLV